MKIVTTNFKLSAVLETKKFMDFSHYYGLYKNAEGRRDFYEDGKRSFFTAELKDPKQELEDMYVESVHRAINKLFVLDKAFFKAEKAHIVTKLESFDEFVEALKEIDAFVAASISR